MKFIFLVSVLHAANFVRLAQAQSWLDNVAAFPNLSTLTTLFRQHFADLNDDFSNDLTILAPNDAAFERFYNTSAGAAFQTDPGLAQALLSYHLVNEVYLDYDPLTFAAFTATRLTLGNYTNVTGGQRIHTFLDQGSYLASGTVTSGLLQNATIFNRTLYDGMGIYISDRVLTLPPSMSSTAIALNLTASVGALSNVALLDNLNNARDLTILMPNNAAFQRVAGDLASLSSSDLSDLMTYHTIVGEVLYTSNLTNGLSIQTPNGVNMTVDNSTGIVYFNNARVVVPDVLISNGVMHVIEDVLNPRNTTAKPGEQAFASATSTGNVPFTSGVPTPTSAIPAGAQSSTSNSAPGSSSSSSGSKSHAGAIAGGVVGGLVGLAVIVFLIWFIKRKRSTRGSGAGTIDGSTATSGGVDRKETVKSFHKAELEATTKAYQKAELEGSNTALTKQPGFQAVSVPTPTTRSELPTTTSAHVQSDGAVVTAPLKSQQGSPAQEEDESPIQQQGRPSSPQRQQQQQSRTGQEEEHEARLAQLNNQRRLAQIEHQKRMAELEHEQRMAELDLAGARLRSRNTTAAELDAESPRSTRQ